MNTDTVVTMEEMLDVFLVATTVFNTEKTETYSVMMVNKPIVELVVRNRFKNTVEIECVKITTKDKRYDNKDMLIVSGSYDLIHNKVTLFFEEVGIKYMFISYSKKNGILLQ